jgi:hypothetical protein
MRALNFMPPAVNVQMRALNFYKPVQWKYRCGRYSFRDFEKKAAINISLLA